MTTAAFLLILLSSLAITASAHNPETKPFKFWAAFYFGDSTLDTGNNDYIPTIVRADHCPYGQDFPGNKPTGRFSNGLLVPDFLGRKLGLSNFSSPFLDPSVSNDSIRLGANFASAGSGFDDTTSLLWNRIPMSRQVEMFKLYLARLEVLVGKEQASRTVANSLILISAGTNDFTRNYYYAANKSKGSIGEYQDFVLHKMEMALKELYGLGGRLFAVANLPPFGCTPLQITLSLKDLTNRECVNYMNNDATIYNSKLRNLLNGLQEKLEGSKFAYIDAYGAFLDILNNYSLHGLPTYLLSRYKSDQSSNDISVKFAFPGLIVTKRNTGFRETKRGCCGTGLAEAGPLCNILTPTCKNASSYIFYDAVHPTQRVYQLLTDSVMETVMQLL